MSQSRLVAIDATRGTAMLFVFLSHFTESYIRPTNKFELMLWLYRISMLASPAFMLMSGIVLGYLYETHKENFVAMKRKLIGRGLFLLTLGRLLIILAHIPIAGGFQQALRWGFITDAIGMSVIVGSLTIKYLRPSIRFFIGLGLFTLSWWLILTWFPDGKPLEAIKGLLFGPMEGYENKIYADVFPIVTWFSLYLFGTCIGSRLGILQIREEMLKATSFVGRVASALSLAAVIILALRILMGPFDSSKLGLALSSQLYPQKLPPTALYFAFYGGMGLSILYGYLKFRENAFVTIISQVTRVFGEVSLFVFVVQYYVYFSVFVLLKLDYSVLWPLYFAASVIIIYIPSRIWYSRGLNKYLTVPYWKIFDKSTRLPARFRVAEPTTRKED